MSRTTFALSKPQGREEISPGILEYFQTRNRMHVFEIVQQEFEKSKISPTDLAKRMGKGTDRVSHLLGAPGNWTLDTVSDLLFAISGAEVEYRLAYPLDRPARNMTYLEWLHPFTIGESAGSQVILPGVATSPAQIPTNDGTVVSFVLASPTQYAGS